MKALWRTHPLLANVDGLNDYDEDFRAVESVFATVTSSWEVGRGYAGQAEEVTKQMNVRDRKIQQAAEIEKTGSGTTAATAGGEAATAKGPPEKLNAAKAAGRNQVVAAGRENAAPARPRATPRRVFGVPPPA